MFFLIRSSFNGYANELFLFGEAVGRAARFACDEVVRLPEREMHLRRSRQVPRRAKRGALRSKVARGCARTPKGPQGAERPPSH